MNDREYRGLVFRAAAGLLVCSAAVAACYFWVDRPVAYFVRDAGVEKTPFWKPWTYPPPTVQTWSPLLLALASLVRLRGPLPRWWNIPAVACLALIVADQFRTSIGDAAGRYWPETWFDDNPSLLGSGAYGFRWFSGGEDVGSFPSGHAARTAAFAVVFWIAAPRTRVLLLAVCSLMLGALVAMNYHFVSDVVAGAYVGGVVGAFAATWTRLRE